MRKKVLSVLCTLIMFGGIFSISFIHAQASVVSSGVKVDGSYLTTADTSTATTNNSTGIGTMDIHLMDGQCSITKAGSGKIYAYAGTTGNHVVDYISVVMYVDRYNQTTKSWGEIYYEQATDYNTYYVATSETLKVEKGYFYRTRSTHVAGMGDNPNTYEMGVTATDGIWID
ncbi:MAG: hypothetical protein QM793_05750 [Muricomes sp.]